MISMSGMFDALVLSRSSGPVATVSYFVLSKRDCKKMGSSRTGDKSRPVPKKTNRTKSLTIIQGRKTNMAKESHTGLRNWIATLT